MTKFIQLTQGKVALVSDHRFEYLNQWKWYARRDRNNWYAVREEDGDKIRMHRLIMGVTDPTILVDHQDGDGLNNQDDNLRKCTNTQNLYNRRINKNSTTGYKGVTWGKKERKYLARIKVNQKTLPLGEFIDPKQAAKAYDTAARHYFGEFARTNFNEGTTS